MDGALDGGKGQHISGKAQAVLRAAAGADELSVVGAVPTVARDFLVGLTLFKLRVIKRKFLIEHQNILRLFQRGPPRVEETCAPALVPHPFIAEHGEVGSPQHLIIGALCEEQHRPLRLDGPFHRLPQLREGQRHIPKVPGGAIGRIGQKHIHRMTGQRAQPRDAVLQEQALRGLLDKVVCSQ